MLAAILHQPVDRVPHATYNLNPYTENAHTSDGSYAQILDKVRASAGVCAKLSAGGCGIGLSREHEGLHETIIEGDGDERTLTTIVHTPKGDLHSIRRIPENKPGLLTKPFVTCDKEADQYLSLPYESPVFETSKIEAFVKSAGDDGVPFVGYNEPVYATACLYGFEEFAVRCVTDMKSIRRVLDWTLERCVENLRLLAKACEGMDWVLHTGGPEICTPPMMSPALFAELVTPSMSRLVEIIHEFGLLAGIHCHGRVRDALPEIIKTGADLLEPIEPPRQGDIALAELMEQAEGRLCLMGYIQDQEFYTAPPGFMTQRVEEIARVVNGRTGYIMTPTCTPFEHPCSDTYNRNYLEWLDAAERLFLTIA